VFSVILKIDQSKNHSKPKTNRGNGRKDYGSTWWGRAWISAMESACGEKVSTLGKLCALEGMVYGVDVRKGSVSANVEGPHAEEYKVVIRFDKIKGNERKELFSLVSDPSVSLALLSNELPLNCEREKFDHLFGNFKSKCTCPEGDSFCAHAAAVFYILSGEIDHAPQILFFLRGISNEDLLSCIRGGVH
jgi:uncharacterized Zn finger protein